MKAINNKVMQFFSNLSDETRLNIVLSLRNGPRNVNDIHNHIGKDKLTLSAVSHQLRQLSQADIVHFEKKGRHKYFHLSEHFCWCILEDALNHFSGKKECKGCCKIKKRRKNA
jgi:DNA-binding transcriptional ArsR family regulator|tara:strand:- start:546 stop:884 length:339 start_codon:yes stop_codon:yes gene_type:complete